MSIKKQNWSKKACIQTCIEFLSIVLDFENVNIKVLKIVNLETF